MITARQALLILNDPPYGTKRSYNGLRLAKALRADGVEVYVFLLTDAVTCAKKGQKVPEGYYNLELRIKNLAKNNTVLLCATFMNARGLDDSEVVEGASRSTMKELVEITKQADRVLVF